MMLPTHALAGMVLALPVVYAAPELGGVAVIGGLLGGVLPDLDMYVGHRRRLHFPVYYSALAAVAVPVAALAPAPATVGPALFVLAAAVHSVADVFGGGLELRPWEGTSRRAVYDHHRGRWIAPRRWIGYDGSPGDFLAASVLSVPLFGALDGPLDLLVVASLVVAAVYAAVRRTLPDLAAALQGLLVPALPARVRERVPVRYLDAFDGTADGH